MIITEKIFKSRVYFNANDLKYIEYGTDFVLFRNPDDGKLYEVRVKEIKPRKKKVKSDASKVLSRK